MSVATPTLADDRQAPPPDTTSGSLHCHGKVQQLGLLRNLYSSLRNTS